MTKRWEVRWWDTTEHRLWRLEACYADACSVYERLASHPGLLKRQLVSRAQVAKGVYSYSVVKECVGEEEVNYV